MPMTALAGTRVRERRIAMGLKQADVAATAGISPSYLNLIEHNRRRIGPEVLDRLAEVLKVEPAALTGVAQGAMLDDLRAAAAGTNATFAAELDQIEEFVGRFPGWASVLVAQAARSAQLERALVGLNDRMTHDPHLSAALHEVLSSVAAIRSTAGILAEGDDIDPVWRRRFHRNLFADSERLAAGSEALVAFLDSSDEAEEQGIAAPIEEVEAWLQGRGWNLHELVATADTEDDVGRLASGAARRLARGLMAEAAADLQALPDRAFAEALARIGPDPARLAAHFGADMLAVFRRLALWPGSQAGLVVCDASGTLTFRKPAEGFPLPRFGSACPLWPLYAALARPMTPIETTVEVAARGAPRFLVRAFCQPRYPQGFAGPEVRTAAMLILPAPAAGGGPALAIGSTCRICPRSDCVARREPSILAEEA